MGLGLTGSSRTNLSALHDQSHEQPDQEEYLNVEKRPHDAPSRRPYKRPWPVGAFCIHCVLRFGKKKSEKTKGDTSFAKHYRQRILNCMP